MTKEQRDWLIKNNLDPEVYDIDAEGNVFENPIMGKLEAGARSAAASLVPAAGGFGGGAAGAAIGAPLGPLGVIAGGLIGGLGGSFGASKIQEAALEKYSPETLEKLSQAQEEQPVASYAGGFLPTALTLRPTTKGLSGLLRPAARQTTLREAISKPEFVAPASNVAINVGQAAAGQALDVSQGAEFSGPRMAADIALGTLFSRPTRLGRKLGLPDIPETAPVQQLDLDRARFMAQPPDEFVTPREERLGVGREKVAPEQFFGTETEQRNRPISEERMAKQYEDWWKSETEPTADFIKEKAARFKVDEFGNTIDALAKEPNANDVVQTPEQVSSFIQNKYGEALQSAYESISKINEIGNKLMRGLAEEQIGEAQRALARQKEAETLGFRDILPKANDAAQDIYSTVSGRLQRQGEGAKITQADIDAAAQIAARRNLKIELDRAFAGDREVRGMWLVNKDGDRVVRVNPLMATPDTAIHEIGHDIFSGVTNPSMRKSLLESAQDSPAYRSELAARQAEVDQGRLTQEQANNYALEEGLIQAFGEQAPSIKRSEIRAWFKAVKASTKQLFTGKISPEDAIAWLHYASTESVPWKGVAAPKAREERMQRGEEPQTISERRAAAFERFKESVPGSQAEMMESGRIFSPDVRAQLESLQAGGTLDREALQAAINRDIPVREVPEFSSQALPNFQTIRDSLSDPRKKANVGKLSEIPAGSEMTLRQDVPAMTDFGVGVVTGTSGDKTTYEPFIRVRNIKMVPTKGMETQSLKIGAGAAKTPTIVAKGTKHESQTIPSDINTWTQVGFNPDRHSYFYDRADGVTPVVGGDEAVQIGNTVFVKNAQTGDPTSFRYQRGEEDATRKFAERVIASEEVPAEVRRRVAESPLINYKRQNVPDAAQTASTLSDRQLTSDLLDAKSNTRVVSGLELYNRAIQSGDFSGASEIIVSMSKEGTTWGQLINQFKLLKSATPEGVIQLVSKSLEQKKRKPMTQAQVTALTDAMNQYRAASDQVTAAKRAARDAIDANNEAAIQQAAKQFDLASAVQGEADVAMNELISRINPSSAADLFVSMVQGSVMSPISIVRNVLGNIINAPLRDVSDRLAAAIDSALFGGKNSSYNYRARSIERLNAFAKSLPQAGKILLKGSDAMPYELGTDIGNPLNFTRAWRNLYEAMSGQYEGAPIARNIVEATLGAIPDVFLRLTQATDVPFRAAERARIITEVGRQRGLSKSQIELAKRDPKLLRITDEQAQAGRKGFTEDDLGLIEYEAAKAVFQQDNAATRMVSGINRFIKQEGGPVAYVPYRLISLFQKTPINVAAEALSFTPAGVLRNWKDMSVREREIATSRLIIGGIVTGAYAYLYDKGVITPNLDTPGETNKARELAKAGGVMPPGTLNVSGLRRLVRGESPTFQPGDTVKDLSALGTSGALGMMVGTAKRLQERSPTDDPDFLALGKGAALSGINFVMEQQFLKGTSDFIKLLSQESGSALDRFVKSLSVTAASPVAPAILGAVRRVERENLPAIGGEGFIKDTVNELNQRFAAIGLQIPGTRDPNAMPVRRDLWGEPVKQTPKSENPWVYNFFSAAKSRQIDADPLNATLYSIWRRTADNQVIPSAINPKITYKGKTFERMTPDQYDRYTQLVGFYRRTWAERAYLSGQFQQRGDEVRINMLKRAYDKGLEIGKYRFLKELRESGQSLTPQAARRGFTAE